MTEMASVAQVLRSRFRGCLAAAVAGDCIGAEFEGCVPVPVDKVLGYVDHVNKQRGREVKFTDDTAMARSVARSLIECKGFDARDMATRFAKEYKREPGRGYGGSVITVFYRLLEEGLQDVFEPARQQFDGRGSYGNGGAMRVAPVALYAYGDVEKVTDIAKQTAMITHYNREGYNGAILEALAVHLALQQGKDEDLNVVQFVDALLQKMKIVEGGEAGSSQSEEPEVGQSEDSRTGQSEDTDGDQSEEEKGSKEAASSKEADQPYCAKLEIMREFLQRGNVSRIEVEDQLGNDIKALDSVPAAIFSFLHCTRSVDDIPTDNALERTIIYAISLGGDTDTIATMAGAIAGAYYGIEHVPPPWMKACEGANDAVRFADQLFCLATGETIEKDPGDEDNEEGQNKGDEGKPSATD
ncbi:PREDICTED: poly(ADP-ribose) glycohydrolase ARH3-like isoform X1 [Branchiostoma belcheri]|uniref:ADP-ribosylhydrolase ARH3 n=1 Tax=Branchiostoma belcheri TaxID=7741 RepID=A0A6P4ZGF3_BRABE|nr:PREDICTED: poly(ADP-ribose) glycohydrolase ARH3-like isoform X1 [Branchiostoma belcheri]